MRTRVVIVTGLSGAGKTSALKALEDIGYEAVDNLPLSLLPRMLSPTHNPPGAQNESHGEEPRAIAIGVDYRTRGFDAASFARRVEILRRRPDLRVSLIYLDCEEETLTRRFTETRRRHPLAVDRPVREGILREGAAMQILKLRADSVIDTTRLSIGELKHLLGRRLTVDARAGLVVTVLSFSYKVGLPREADLVFDVRFLSNPYWREELRAKSGLDDEVRDFIAEDPAFADFFDAIGALLTSLLPNYAREGKSYLTIAIGCTGGRHRSVFVAERLAAFLAAHGADAEAHHRDLALA